MESSATKGVRGNSYSFILTNLIMTDVFVIYSKI